MKRFSIVIVVLLTVAFFAGCGIREKAQEKAAEEWAEQMLENAGVGNVDIDGDTINIQGEDGDSWTINGSEWPTSGLAQRIPECTAGTVTGVYDSTDSVLITLESVSEADAAAYFEVIKGKFTLESYDVNIDGGKSYGAKNAEGVGVALQYSSDGTMTISINTSAE